MDLLHPGDGTTSHPGETQELPSATVARQLRFHRCREHQPRMMSRTLLADAPGAVVAAVLAICLAPTFGVVLASAWLVAKAAGTAFRIAVARMNRHLPAQRPDGCTLSHAAIAVDALVWGLGGLFSAGGGAHTTGLVVLCLAAVASVTALELQLDFQATTAFVVPSIVPTVAELMLRGDGLGLVASACLVPFLIHLLISGYLSERRVLRELDAHEQSQQALGDRAEALALASYTWAKRDEALLALRHQGSVRNRLLATMSHELRAPLHDILGLVELLQDEPMQPVNQHRLQLIQASGAHLLELTDAALDASQIESDRIGLQNAPFDLALEVGRLVDLYTLRAHAKGLAFHAAVQLDSSCWVSGDATRLRQVLHNLLGNAVKFTERGSIWFTVVKADRAGTVGFEISDTGIGIDPSEQALIFEAFGRARDADVRHRAGVGLGLTIARGLARAMGGDISVSSTVGVGSTFTCTASLRSAAAPARPASPSGRRVPASPGRAGGRRVLLVEDNEVNALIAQAFLERLGVEAVLVADGLQAVEAATGSRRPDLVLMDCRMPNMDGFEATRRIRRIEANQGLERVPIVALTAATRSTDRAECREAGMDDILTKPFSDAELAAAVNTHLEAAALRAAMPGRQHPSPAPIRGAFSVAARCPAGAGSKPAPAIV